MNGIVFTSLFLLTNSLLFASNDNNVQEQNDKIIFNEENYYILCDDIIVENKEKSYETIRVEFSLLDSNSDESSSLKFDYSNEYYEITNLDDFYDENKNIYFLDVIGKKSTKGVEVNLNVTYKETFINSTNIYVIDSYINFTQNELNKVVPVSTDLNNPNTFVIKLIDDSTISNINKKDIDIIVEDETFIERIDNAFDPIDYGAKFKIKNKVGETHIKYNFNRDLNKDGKDEIIREFDIKIKIIDVNNYFYFYTLNDDNELELFDETEIINLETYDLLELYIGNINNEINTDLIKISNYEEIKRYFNCLDTNIIKINNNNFLKLDIIPLDEFNGKINISVGDNDKNNKILNFNVVESNYNISTNEDFLLPNRYYIFEGLPLFNDNSNQLIKANEEIINVNYFYDKTTLLGKNKIIAQILFKNDVTKYYRFNLYFTLNTDFYSGDSKLEDEYLANIYKRFLNNINKNKLSSYSLNEKYNDLEYEYINSLNKNVREILGNDFEFIKNYRYFIINNDFRTSFFKEISVNFGFSRLIPPILIVSFSGVLFFITLGTSLYYIYKRKGNSENE